MRKRLWKLHSWLGLIAGLGLLVIGLTGSLLVFHEELEQVLNPELVRVAPGAQGRLPYDQLLASVNDQLPGYEVAGWLPQHDHPEFADVVYVMKHGTGDWLLATLDPYTGRILASPRKGTETFTGWLLELHYAFFADHAGVFIVGIFGVLLMALGVTGVWLYRDFWKNVFTLRWGRGARILFSDIHKFAGITSVVFNLALGFTGAYWNLTHVAGHWLEEEHEEPVMVERLYAGSLSLDALAGDAAKRVPGFRANYLSFPISAEAPAVTFYGASEPRSRWSGPYGSYVAYDARRGRFMSATDIRDAGGWARFVDGFTPVHFGTFGGLPVKILWAFIGLTPAILSISGFCIWWMRNRRRPAAKNVGAGRRALESASV